MKISKSSPHWLLSANCRSKSTEIYSNTCEAALHADTAAISLTSSSMNSRYPSPPRATEISSSCSVRAIGKDSWREPPPKAYVLRRKRWVRRGDELQLLSSETGVHMPWVSLPPL